MFGKSDSFRVLILTILSLVISVYGLDAVEFFRHTEADRTLISWEMAQSGDYIIPRLTHSIILTKPPLYYWLLAGVIKFFGSAEEWIVRLPSVITGWLLVLSTYYFSRRAGLTQNMAFLGAFILATSGQFLYIANTAEMDMTSGFFSGLALFALFVGVTFSSWIYFLLAYMGLALALLTKGLPIFVFFFAVQFLYVAHRWYRLPLNRGKDLLFLMVTNLAGMMLLALLVVPWIYELNQAIGIADFWAQTKVEVFERIVQDVRYRRGIFYYFGVVAIGFVPWVMGLVIAIVAWGKRFILQQIPGRDYESSYDLFITYCLVVVGVIFVSLSTAEGKSARYLFPLAPFLSCLIAASFAFIWRGNNREWILRVVKYFGVLILTLLPFFAFALLCRFGISVVVVAVYVTLMLMVGLLFYKGGVQKDLVTVLTGMAMLAFSIRVGDSEILAPYRNRELSVKWVATTIDREIPAGARLYNLELFDRWLTYYLKRLGRESYRLEPANLPDTSSAGGKSYILISGNEETWRLDEIRSIDPASRVVHDFSETRDKFILIEMDSGRLSAVRFTKRFPTYPSVPWF